ncbi:hypothetical protein PHISP_05111 [Aspergillus sp. HF37]|nr:hypothetical protein PHISP_05111 [Aspergillus sp. HF37]
MQSLDPGLSIDPMLRNKDDADDDDDDDDYEYEYHLSETETFYLNLDLTTQPGPIRPPRRRTQQSATPATAVDEDDGAIESTETDTPPADRAQLLGLHTANPIVSYQNQIFSCSWADQIGTELFFAHPETEPDPSVEAPAPALRHGRDFDLIAANSVKLLGSKAVLMPSAGVAPGQEQTADSQGPGHPGMRGPQTNQSRFLERLMGVKQARGETDQVRTVCGVRREQNATWRLDGWARTEEQLEAVRRLNDAARQGDEEAIVALEEICARIAGDSESDDNSQS